MRLTNYFIKGPMSRNRNGKASRYSWNTIVQKALKSHHKIKNIVLQHDYAIAAYAHIIQFEFSIFKAKINQPVVINRDSSTSELWLTGWYRSYKLEKKISFRVVEMVDVKRSMSLQSIFYGKPNAVSCCKNCMICFDIEISMSTKHSIAVSDWNYEKCVYSLFCFMASIRKRLMGL